MRNKSDLPLNIQQRYGMDKSQKLPVIIALIVAIIVGAGLGLANLRKSQPSLDWELRAFNVESPTNVAVVWEVARAQDKDSYCVLRAQDEKRMDVGYATIFIPGGERKVTVAYDLTTESLAVLVEVLGCANQPEMRVPPADFPPGVKIPSQVPPGFAPTQ
jgi:hypothetical protein